MAQATHTQLTAAQFAQLPETNTPNQLINGVLIVTPAPTNTHQTLVFNLAQLVSELAAGSSHAKISPLDVHLDEHNVLQPDIFWVSGPDSLCQLGDDDKWYGAPDLVVEVLSPATARYDKVEKFRLYAKHGVREYWIIDPIAQYIEVWILEEGSYQRQGVYGPQDSFTSPMLGGKTVDLKPIFTQ